MSRAGGSVRRELGPQGEKSEKHMPGIKHFLPPFSPIKDLFRSRARGRVDGPIVLFARDE